MALMATKEIRPTADAVMIENNQIDKVRFYSSVFIAFKGKFI